MVQEQTLVVRKLATDASCVWSIAACLSIRQGLLSDGMIRLYVLKISP